MGEERIVKVCAGCCSWKQIEGAQQSPAETVYGTCANGESPHYRYVIPRKQPHSCSFYFPGGKPPDILDSLSGKSPLTTLREEWARRGWIEEQAEEKEAHPLFEPGYEGVRGHLYKPEGEGDRNPKGFMICPMRNASVEEVEAQRQLVLGLEEEGWEIHWPPRDTDQDDSSGGWNICNANRGAIEAADRVFVYWDGKSYGSHFDLGMAFAYKKPITVLWKPPEKHYAPKSFRKLLATWELLYGQEPT